MKQLLLIAVLCAGPLASCAAVPEQEPATQTGLTGRDWTLMDLDGQAVAPASRPAHIRLEADGRYSGSGGCNAISGAYTLDPGNRIHFSQGIHTMMACQTGMDTERGLAQALNQADSYTVSGDTLTLETIGSGAVARFTADTTP